MIGGSHGPFCDDQGGSPSAIIAHALDDQHVPRLFDLLPGIRPHCNPAAGQRRASWRRRLRRVQASWRRCTYSRRGHHLRALRAFFRPFAFDEVVAPAIAKSSMFFPPLMAAVSQRGFNPRPAHVSTGFSGLRYLGATAPLAPPRPKADFPRAAPPWKRPSFESSDTIAGMRCHLDARGLPDRQVWSGGGPIAARPDRPRQAL
jgi:hypothetical protein